MDIAALAIQLISGVVGGNAAGAAAKGLSLGTTGNSIAGGLGGVIISQLLPMLMGNTAAAATGLDLATIVAGFASGGIGGAVTALVIGFIKTKMAK